MEWKLKSDRTVYLQIMDYIRMQIISGELRSGDKLLSIRELANTMNVNPSTVQRAYSELERIGLVYIVQSVGSIVTNDIEIIKQSKEELARNYTLEFFSNMITMGFSKEEILSGIKKIADNEAI